MKPEHVPVVVIGAGPTGASTAIMLGQRGIRCLVLKRWPEVYPVPRAVHFDDEVFRIFADMDLADEVAAISRPMPGMRLTDPKHRVLAEINRDANQHGYPQANMFDQPALERVLRSALNKYPSVELRGGFDVAEIAEVAEGPARYGSDTAPPTRSPAPVLARCGRCGPTTCSAPTGRTAAPARRWARAWTTSASSSSGSS